MTTTPDVRLPHHIDPAAVLDALGRVLDPELDESVLALGFVQEVSGDEAGNVNVNLRLPTYWCAANFSYLMASDARRELLDVAGVNTVTVNLAEHFASREVEIGSGSGMTFGEAFPEGGPDSLEETRQIFLVKGFYTRQEKLLQALKRSRLTFEEIANLRIQDVPPAVDDHVLTRYLERRSELELNCSDASPLIVDIKGDKIGPQQMENYYVRARTTRLAMEANGSLCSAMLQSRNSNWTKT